MPLFLRIFVGIVHDADKPNAPKGKQAVYVLFHQLQLPGKAGLGLAQDNVKPPLFRVLQKAVKFRSPPVCAGAVLVTVEAVKFPPLFSSVFQQHGLLKRDLSRVFYPMFFLSNTK